jgi:hypothetical protein
MDYILPIKRKSTALTSLVANSHHDTILGMGSRTWLVLMVCCGCVTGLQRWLQLTDYGKSLLLQ